MITVYKYPLAISDSQVLQIPGARQPLHVGLDPANQLCLWWCVDTEEPPVTMTIRICGTGNPIHPKVAPKLEHLGSAVVGSFVWHVFVESSS